MRVFRVDQDMDRDGMLELRPAFDELARSSTDVCLDLSGVRFLDESGVEEMATLHRRLRGRALKLAIVNAGEQPLRRLRGLMLERWAGPLWRRTLSSRQPILTAFVRNAGRQPRPRRRTDHSNGNEGIVRV